MARQDLLDAVLDDIQINGVADRSLRDIAAAVGSSHRMLIYHFGSREGLIEAIVHEQSERSRRHDRELFQSDGKDGLVQRWERHRSSGNRDDTRMFFDLASYAMRQTDATARFRAEYAEPWLEMSAAVAEDFNVDVPTARAFTRLDLAVLRGLLHDLLVTGEEEEIDLAFTFFAHMRQAAITAQLER